MTDETLLRIASLCAILAMAETLHGVARTLLLVPRLGKEQALKLSALTGSILAFLICYLWVPAVGLTGPGQHLGLGLGLAAFMASFDIALGLVLLHKSWAQVLRDFDPRTGNYLLFGLAALVFIPWLVSALRS